MNRAQKKTLFLLAGILAVLAAILAAATLLKDAAEEEAAEEEAAGSENVITEQDAAYTALTYDNGTATLSFHLDENGDWVWSDDPTFPLDQTNLTSLMYLLTDLVPQQTITEGDTLEAYGLDQPSASLTATKADGSELTIALGNATIDGTSYYMLLNGQQSPVYIISDRLYTYISKSIYDMCDLPELPELSEESIRSISIKGAVTTVLQPVDRQTEEDPETGAETVSITWYASGEDVTELDNTEDLLFDVEHMTLDKCVDYKPSAEAASLCGFDEPRAEMTVLYTTDTGADGSLTLIVGGESLEENSCYVRVNDDPTIYQMRTANVNVLLGVAQGGMTVDLDAGAEE